LARQTKAECYFNIVFHTFVKLVAQISCVVNATVETCLLL